MALRIIHICTGHLEQITHLLSGSRQYTAWETVRPYSGCTHYFNWSNAIKGFFFFIFEVHCQEVYNSSVNIVHTNQPCTCIEIPDKCWRLHLRFSCAWYEEAHSVSTGNRQTAAATEYENWTKSKQVSFMWANCTDMQDSKVRRASMPTCSGLSEVSLLDNWTMLSVLLASNSQGEWKWLWITQE